MTATKTKTLKPWEGQSGAYNQEESFAAAQVEARAMLEWLDAREAELKVSHRDYKCRLKPRQS